MKSQVVRARVLFGANEEYRVHAAGAVLRAEPSGVLRAFGEMPGVGDWVNVRVTGDFALIESVEERRTAFVRKAAGRSHSGQCIAANVDAVFIVCGLDGDFSARRLERYLVLVRESGAHPVVVLNKTDVCPDVPGAVANTRLIAGDAAVVAISARQSVDTLRKWLQADTTTALLGSSGAGKSTIANALSGTDLATQDVRAHDSRGRHTTTGRMLLQLPSGAWLMDTPGMRELGLLASDESVEQIFPEIAALASECRFADCEHLSEPGCVVREALQDGRLDQERWKSYTKLQREARHNRVQEEASARQAEKQRWKTIHKAQKQMYKERGR